MPNDINEARPQLDIRALNLVPEPLAAQIKNATTLAAVPTAAPVPPGPLAPKPGTERWPVKTGIDDDAVRVGSNDQMGEGIVNSTVEELIQLPRPADMRDVRSPQPDFQDRRAAPVEFVIWQVTADIIAIKKEADGDLHMVLQGNSGETMIAEAPTPKSPFVTSRSPWLDAMKTVRKRIAEKFGPSFAGLAMQPLDSKYVMPAVPVPPPVAISPVAGPAAPITEPPGGDDIFEDLQPFKAKVEPTAATITGVGFFDRVHDQMGVAMKNGIELHPVLEIEFHD